MTATIVALVLLLPGTVDREHVALENIYAGGATVTAPAQRIPTVAVDEPPVPPLSNEDVIRAVWPDNLEQTAVAIAYRESRLQCCVKTYCCYGLLQINWIAHHTWLIGELGLTNAYDLYDPWTNAVAGYRLYQKDGWRPWAV